MIDGLEDQWAEFEYLALHMDDYDEDEGFCSDPGACLSHGTTKDRTIINFCYQKVSIISAGYHRRHTAQLVFMRKYTTSCVHKRSHSHGLAVSEVGTSTKRKLKCMTLQHTAHGGNNAS